MAGPLFTFDTETFLIQPGEQVPQMVCMSFAIDGGPGHLLHVNDPVAYRVLRDALESGMRILGHETAYDVLVTSRQWPDLFPLWIQAYDQDRVTDTGIRAKLIDIALGQRKFVWDEEEESVKKTSYNLGALAQRYLKRKLDKDTWRLRYGELYPFPVEAWPAGAQEYPKADVEVPRDIYGLQESSAAYLEDQYRQARAGLWLKAMSAWGFPTSPEGVEKFRLSVKGEYDELVSHLIRVGLRQPDGIWAHDSRPDAKKPHRAGDVNPGKRNMKLAREKLVAAYYAQGRDYPKSDTGLPSLSATSCKESGDPDLMAMGKLGPINAAMVKDYPMLLSGTTTPIHSYFEVLLETGRTSSSKPNIQNPRRAFGVRECFVPRPGKVLVSADYGKLELCTLGQVCIQVLGWSTLADALNAGKDPHLMIAATILGRPYDDVHARYAVEDKDAAEWKAIDDARQSGKVANFGYPGGLGYAAFTDFAKDQYGVILTEAEARALKEYWQATFPEMRLYLDWIGRLVESPGASVCHLYSNRWRGNVRFTQAANSFFQGLGGDVAKAAGWLIFKACYLDTSSPLYGSRILNFVHDEFILECDPGIAHECALELSHLMVEGARPWLPGVNIEAVPLISRRWSKKAKPVWKDGRLVPCP